MCFILFRLLVLWAQLLLVIGSTHPLIFENNQSERNSFDGLNHYYQIDETSISGRELETVPRMNFISLIITGELYNTHHIMYR